jgi:hypothetical protein
MQSLRAISEFSQNSGKIPWKFQRKMLKFLEFQRIQKLKFFMKLRNTCEILRKTEQFEFGEVQENPHLVDFEKSEKCAYSRYRSCRYSRERTVFIFSFEPGPGLNLPIRTPPLLWGYSCRGTRSGESLCGSFTSRSKQSVFFWTFQNTFQMKKTRGLRTHIFSISFHSTSLYDEAFSIFHVDRLSTLTDN